MKLNIHRTAILISLLLLLGFVSVAAAGPGEDLIAAATRGDLGAVLALLDKGVDVNAKDGKGQTALYFAALHGHKDVAALLIANKADLNVGANDGVTPLQIAIVAGHREVAELLIAKGADVNAKANSGFAALSFAASLGRKDLAELLIADGADVDTKTGSLTALYLAAANGHRDVAELLIAKGADVNAKDSTGLTLLHTAASNGQRDVVELLIANQANVNATTNDGVTPLQAAAVAGHREVAELLIANGADVNARAHSGFTALSFAEANGHKDVAELLSPSKAVPSSSDPADAKALVYVYRRQHLPPPALYTLIFINRLALGNLGNNSYVQLSVPKGKAAVIATSADDRNSLGVTPAAFPECADLLSPGCLAAIVHVRDSIHQRLVEVFPLAFQLCSIERHFDKVNGKLMVNWNDWVHCESVLDHVIMKLRSTLSGNPLEFQVEEGKTYYVKWSVHSFKGVKIEVVDATEGAKEVKGLPLAKN